VGEGVRVLFDGVPRFHIPGIYLFFILTYFSLLSLTTALLTPNLSDVVHYRNFQVILSIQQIICWNFFEVF